MGTDNRQDVVKATVDEGQPCHMRIPSIPQNLLERVIVDEKMRIGVFFDWRIKRLAENNVRVFLSFERNELENSSLNEIHVLGHSAVPLVIDAPTEVFDCALLDDGRQVTVR
jgi:hypothetical protein